MNTERRDLGRFVALSAIVWFSMLGSAWLTSQPPHAVGADDYAQFSRTIESPCAHWYHPTLSDTVDLSHASRQVKFKTAGDFKVDTVGGETLTIYGVQEGEVLTGQFTRIYSTGTTATTDPSGSDTTDITVGY